LTAFSPADLVVLYHTNLRDFDPATVVVHEYPPLYEDLPPPPPLTASPCFRSKGRFELFENKSPAKHLIAADPMEPPPPVVPLFERQKPREFPVDIDANRVYHNAVSEQMALMSRMQQQQKFEEQYQREATPI
jgi:hypothetical protein